MADFAGRHRPLRQRAPPGRASCGLLSAELSAVQGKERFSESVAAHAPAARGAALAWSPEAWAPDGGCQRGIVSQHAAPSCCGAPRHVRRQQRTQGWSGFVHWRLATPGCRAWLEWSASFRAQAGGSYGFAYPGVWRISSQHCQDMCLGRSAILHNIAVMYSQLGQAGGAVPEDLGLHGNQAGTSGLPAGSAR